MGDAPGDEAEGGQLPTQPDFPHELIEVLKGKLNKKDAPFLKYLGKKLNMVWIDSDDSRLGMTRFEYNANELFRRRKMKLSCGPVTIGINPILNKELEIQINDDTVEINLLNIGKFFRCFQYLPFSSSAHSHSDTDNKQTLFILHKMEKIL